MSRPAIQLYTLRTIDRPVPELLKLVAAAGFEGVEFAYRVLEADFDEVVATLEETGLDVAAAHIPIDLLEDDFAATVDSYARLGVEQLVVPWLDAECFESVEGVEAAAERLATLEERLAACGMTLHYHNHIHEFVPLDGATGFDAFVDSTNFGIEYDVGLAYEAGDDVGDRLRALGERSQLVHLRDYDAETDEYVPVGEGDVALARCAASLRTAEWLIYEYEGEDPVGSLDQAAAVTREWCS